MLLLSRKHSSFPPFSFYGNHVENGESDNVRSGDSDGESDHLSVNDEFSSSESETDNGNERQNSSRVVGRAR